MSGFLSGTGLGLMLMASAMALEGFAQSPAGDESPAAYAQRISKWRKGVEADLKTKTGWLSVAGLFWLKPGDNSFGSNPSSDLVFPNRVADRLGTLTRNGNEVMLKAAPDAPVKVDGKPVGIDPVRVNSSTVSIGDIEFVILGRGDRIGVRLFDPESEAQKQFKGEKWYPIEPNFVIHAKYTPYAIPRSMPITNVLGDTAPVSNPGYVTFTINGKECRLEAQGAGRGFFFNFRDLTSGKTTYPAGRFLDAPGPVDGMVTLDFNRATNPPCAFTSFATCPLPPSANDLDVAIEAGEKTHHPPGEF